MRCWHPLLLPFLLLAGCVQQTALRAPSRFVPFEAPEKAFKGLRPDGWREVKGVSKGKMSGVSFNQYDAKIGITVSLESTFGGLPTEKIHREYQERASQGLTNYQEPSTKAFRNHLGEGYLSEFTGELKAPIGSNKVHGYRATILTKTNHSEVTVVARCWETDWASLEPAFKKVIESLETVPPSGGG